MTIRKSMMEGTMRKKKIGSGRAAVAAGAIAALVATAIPTTADARDVWGSDYIKPPSYPIPGSAGAIERSFRYPYNATREADRHFGVTDKIGEMGSKHPLSRGTLDWFDRHLPRSMW
jgi:hypothetical protein